MEENLDGSSLDLGGDVFYALVNQSKLLQKEALGRSSVLEIVEDEAKVAAVLQRKSSGRSTSCGFLRISPRPKPTLEKADFPTDL